MEDFEEIRQEDFYYVDKTQLIEQLLVQWGKVNLFICPRRFGAGRNPQDYKIRNRGLSWAIKRSVRL